MSGDGGLFASTPAPMEEAVDGHAWVAAMLAFEGALAAASEQLEVVPRGTASAVEAAIHTLTVDVDELRRAGANAGTPVIPLVSRLSSAAGDAGAWVHYGATSQDAVDTALSLVAHDATAVLIDDLRSIASRLADLAAQHRHSVMFGRTLLQQGALTTFGLKAAGWLVSMVDAAEFLAGTTAQMPVQLGGPVGTLGVLGDRGVAVVEALALRLELVAPTLPWHTNRVPVARVAAALTATAGVITKMAADLVLLAQSEVGEVSERHEQGRGTSSAMPHKQNPVAAVRARAAARRAATIGAALVSSPDHEHERAAGAWQAEQAMVSDLYRHTGEAVAAISDALDGLAVHQDRMASAVRATCSWSAEALSAVLGPVLGRSEAQQLVRDALARASSAPALCDALAHDPRTADHLAELKAILDDPLTSVGPVDELIDAALARYSGSVLAT
jgi:3-carboxy-cis,cis-muconate cycloisomerase